MPLENMEVSKDSQGKQTRLTTALGLIQAFAVSGNQRKILSFFILLFSHNIIIHLLMRVDLVQHSGGLL